MPPSIQILPSLLAADFGRLAEDCRRAEAAGADALHLDVMDGQFVRNLSFGPAITHVVREAVTIPLHVHLMVVRPDWYIRAFAEAGATTLLIHVEAPCDVAATLRDIRGLGLRPGVTLNPETPAAAAAPFLETPGLADEVLCMTVHPGFGGQAFLPHVLPKIADLRRRRPDLRISVDGGLDFENAPACAAQGADVLIAGTTLFRAPDLPAAIVRMRALAEAARPAKSA